MAKSDYGKWFVATDGSDQAIKCNREKFIDCLKDVFGSSRAASMFNRFRKATFSEHCSLELDLLED